MLMNMWLVKQKLSHSLTEKDNTKQKLNELTEKQFDAQVMTVIEKKYRSIRGQVDK